MIISVAMMACHREGYGALSTIAAGMLADERMGDRLTVVLDSDELRGFEHVKHLVPVKLLSPEEAAMQQGKRGQQRALLTYQRCLREANEDGVLVIEDDLTFTPWWLRRAITRIVHCRRQYGERFLLYFYWGWGLQEEYGVHELDPVYWGYGTLAVYWPAVLAKLCALTFGEDPTLDGYAKEWAADAYVSYWCRKNKIPILICNPNLVQHAGRGSTHINSNVTDDAHDYSRHFDGSDHARMRR
jgi:hypothetical protein